MKPEQFTAIDGVCAWPNLTSLPDGDIVATIWNQPTHGNWEGDLECWGSSDGGRSWVKRAQITEHEPGTNRFNCATGLAANGDLVTLVSGWSHRPRRGEKPLKHPDEHTLQAWVFRSSDGGHHWTRTGELPLSGRRFQYVPFGDIQLDSDGNPCATVYIRNEDCDRYGSYFIRSLDDGYTWTEFSPLNPEGNETATLHLGQGHWLAASREEDTRHLEKMVSQDGGRTWEKRGPLTRHLEITGHLMRLHDQRLMLSYGNRIGGQCGVDVRFSQDGEIWSEPVRLADMPNWDGGYPSSIQRPDGAVVTAFYSDHPERGSNQYQMDVVIWKP